MVIAFRGFDWKLKLVGSQVALESGPRQVEDLSEVVVVGLYLACPAGRRLPTMSFLRLVPASLRWHPILTCAPVFHFPPSLCQDCCLFKTVASIFNNPKNIKFPGTL